MKAENKCEGFIQIPSMSRDTLFIDVRNRTASLFTDTPCGGSTILSQNEVIRRRSRCKNRTEEMNGTANIHTKHIQEAGPASAVALNWDQRESGSSLHEHNITQQTGWKSPQGYGAQIRQETGRNRFCFLLAKYIYSNMFKSSLNTR